MQLDWRRVIVISHNNYAMKVHTPVDQDALRMVGTMLRFVRVVDQQFRRYSPSVSLNDLSVLFRIKRGVDTPSGLADALHLDRPRVTRITDHLVELGYIDRQEDQADRRRCRLSLTESGETYLEDAIIATSEAVDKLLNALDDSDRNALLRGVEAVRPVVDGQP
jgi:DNA-binding MarR family transcriptional regulator